MQEVQWEAAKANLVPCKTCGRRFNADRVGVHERICKAKPMSASMPPPPPYPGTESDLPKLATQPAPKRNITEQQSAGNPQSGSNIKSAQPQALPKTMNADKKPQDSLKTEKSAVS